MVGTRRSASQALDPGLGMNPPTRTNKPKATPRNTVARRSNNSNDETPPPPPPPPPPAPHPAPGWSHAPTTATLVWLAVSLPLVAWDTGYVLGRPATMPGGWAHAPLWTPYALYGTVDHMYGVKQWAAGNGFTAAQACLNVVETVLYLLYLGLWWWRQRVSGGDRRVAGRAGALAVVLGLSASVMTVSKTVLYWLNEGFSGFDNIGHNTVVDLVLLWIIPKYVCVPVY